MSDMGNQKLAELFMPYAADRLAEIEKKATKFAYYTSAETALSVIKCKSVWMRSSLVMNDFDEIQHGQACVKMAWNGEVAGTRMKAALQRIEPNIWQEVCDLYNDSDFDQRTDSYMVCVSEHGVGAVDEDKYGRLSMWRAYGGDTNVALVINNDVFQMESRALNAFASPVMYADVAKFEVEFLRVVENIERNIDLLKSLPPQTVVNMLFNALLFSGLSTKHPGFSEEREWRVLHSPRLHPSERLQFDIEIVDGVPQKIYKLPLENIPDEGLEGIEPKELISEVIIGPTSYPLPIFDAFVAGLEDAGFDEPEKIIRVSGIPLRR